MLYGVSLRYKESANVSQTARMHAVRIAQRVRMLEYQASGRLTAFVLLSWQCRMVRAERAARRACPTAQLSKYALTLVLAPQEANYAHQQELDMIPLMMQKDYSPKGWLGLILGTRMW